MECGRNTRGHFNYLVPNFTGTQSLPPTAVWFIDSHGQSSLHQSLAPKYDHVFFAVWAKRDIFIDHPSAHWCPNATDLTWFGRRNFQHIVPIIDFGFFGSKGGLQRAHPLQVICDRHNWLYDIRQVAKPYRHKWPMTGEAMSNCKYLFNHGQKHDGPNQRVMESMACGRPLLTDVDPRDGMNKLFVDGHHYIGYESYTYNDLEENMKWVRNNPTKCHEIVENAYEEVKNNHTIANRAYQMYEVLNAKN